MESGSACVNDEETTRGNRERENVDVHIDQKTTKTTTKQEQAMLIQTMSADAERNGRDLFVETLFCANICLL